MTESSHSSDNTEPEIIVGPREQLFHLLAEAAEIEHTLMCSYLYAAFSLKRGEEDGLTATQAEVVNRWRKAIVAVALDEMVHLVLVSNLSVAIGGRPHFNRPNFPVAPGYFPSGVVVKLTPFSPETLEHFVYLERPQGMEREDGEGFEHEQEYRREEAYQGLMPSVQDYTTVSRLYDALRLNLTACSNRLGESRLFIGPVAGQVSRELVDLEGVSVVADLRTALLAIDTIVEQGEGSPAKRDDSHYERFRSIQNEYASLSANDPLFAPAWPTAINPVMRRPPEPEGKIFIDDPAAARVLDFANAVYGQLLRFLAQAFGRPAQLGLEVQKQALDAAIDLMHVLARAGSALARMPANTTQLGVNAGLTFTMLRNVEPLMDTDAEEQLTLERLNELAQGGRVAARFAPSLFGIDHLIARIRDRIVNRKGDNAG
ncbi:MAG: ferritin-like domain-containing protein [Povalibacter sp.]